MDQVRSYDLHELLRTLQSVVLTNGAMAVITPGGREFAATKVSIREAANGHRYILLSDGKEFAQFRLK